MSFLQSPKLMGAAYLSVGFYISLDGIPRSHVAA